MDMNIVDNMCQCHCSCPCLGGMSVYEEEESDCVNVQETVEDVNRIW